MPTPRDRAGRRSRFAVVRDREITRTASVNVLLIAILGIAAWVFAPELEGLGFWQDSFRGADARPIVPIVFGLFMLGAMAPPLWPQTWESELLARAVRGLAWAALLHWLVGIVLRAPEASVAFLLPVLLGVSFTALGVARRLPHGRPGPYLGVLVTTIGAVAILVPFWLAGPHLIAFAYALPGATVYGAGVPLTLRRERALDQGPTERAPGARTGTSPTHPLDLPPETLHPAGGALALFVTAAYLLFAVVIVAPGVPLPGPVAWIAFAVTIPAFLRILARRQGVAHPRGLSGPPEARVHESVVQHLPDEQLATLDDAIDRFIRTGRGRRRLARALAALLAPAVPDTDERRLDRLLRRIPRAPWARKRRAADLERLLGGARILDAMEAKP